MRIIFDLRRTGLGNNGGSLTLVKSGNALKDLGHEVYFIDSFKNQHTWNKLQVKHIIPKNEKEVPNADFIIATGYKSVATTSKASKRLGKKVHYIRGWETWIMPEKQIVSDILNKPTIKIVNSICLQRKLNQFNISSKIIRPGYDLDNITPKLRKKIKKDFLIIGGLYTSGKHVGIKRTQWIFESYKILKKKYKNLQLWMIGNTKCKNPLVDNFFYRPTLENKNYFYNYVDIWLSPSMQEGLHMPPAEAMMSECPVVGTSTPMSGTEDYLIHNYSGLVSKNDFKSYVKNIESLILNNKLRENLGTNSRLVIEKLGNREDNMRELIKYLEGYE